jgi:hypothetical protein
MKGFAEGKPYPSYKDVYERLTQESVYAMYTGGVFKAGLMTSPIGARDRHASFSIFWSHRKGKYLFKEFRYGYTGDCVDLVRYIYNYKDNTRACMRIMHDFGIDDYHIDSDIGFLPSPGSKVNKSIVVSPPKREVEIKITVRDWVFYDVVFWGQFGITMKWLQRGNVYPISHYYVNGYMRHADTYAYAYVENKDGIFTYKIYQPFADKKKKWLNSNDSSVWELWDLLPERFPILIITKSRKDALSIMSTIGIPSTALQSEGTKPKPQVMDELKSRFDRIIVFYDNDFDKETNYGLKYAQSLQRDFGLEIMMLPSEYGEKDYSDFVKKYGPNKARKVLEELVKTLNNENS